MLKCSSLNSCPPVCACVRERERRERDREREMLKVVALWIGQSDVYNCSRAHTTHTHTQAPMGVYNCARAHTHTQHTHTHTHTQALTLLKDFEIYY